MHLRRGFVCHGEKICAWSTGRTNILPLARARRTAQDDIPLRGHPAYIQRCAGPPQAACRSMCSVNSISFHAQKIAKLMASTVNCGVWVYRPAPGPGAGAGPGPPPYRRDRCRYRCGTGAGPGTGTGAGPVPVVCVVRSDSTQYSRIPTVEVNRSSRPMSRPPAPCPPPRSLLVLCASVCFAV